jgi:hypothetical protein
MRQTSDPFPVLTLVMWLRWLREYRALHWGRTVVQSTDGWSGVCAPLSSGREVRVAVSGVVTESSSECGDGFVQCGVDTADVVRKSSCSRSNDLVSLSRGRFAFEYDGAASSIALDQAVSFEGPVRTHHGVFRKAEISGELTNRRQLASCYEDTASDLAVELAA